MRQLLSTMVGLTLAFNSYASAQNHPTLVLVHGALLTSSVWAPVQSDLQQRGYNVVTVDTPGRLNDGVEPNDATLDAAVEKVCKVVFLQSEPVVLVGHNQAGAIITQATNTCGSHIKGLIYIAAVLPLSGERPFDALSDQDNKNFDTIAPLDAKTGLSQPDINAPIKALLMADADDATAARAISNLVPEPIIFAYNVLSYDTARFNQIPKFYIRTSNDLIISLASQDKLIKRQKMTGVTVLETSHTPFISQPKLLAKKLTEITDTL